MENVRPVYLIMVNPDNKGVDSNKFWNAYPQNNGTFIVRYGRVGGSEQSHIYNMSQWDKKIKEKLRKGYVDVSGNYQEVIEESKEDTEDDAEDEFTLIKNNSVREIIKRLYEYANNVIQASYKVQANVVTQKMVDDAQKILDDLNTNYKKLSVEDFNEKLIKLFVTIPRKMKRVADHLVSNKDEFTSVLEEEQSILDTMAGQVYQPKEKQIHINLDGSEYKESMLEKMGITMEDATEEDVEIIKKAMGDSAHRFVKAWRVSNYETEKRYKKYVIENSIGNVRLLCHGSRNQNWFNILKTGMLIRPSCAIATGNLFGLGLYWSNPDKYNGGVAKSIGYTSVRSAYWTSGGSDTGFIAFFDVAIGDSYDVYSFGSQYYDFNLEKLQQTKPGAWSLWAHGQGSRNGGSTLINDEIIVYNINQATIRYLVEIK